MSLPVPADVWQSIRQFHQDTRLSLQRSRQPQLIKYKFWIGAAMAVQEYLPGSPTKRLVKLVRLILRKYGIKPHGKQWRATLLEVLNAPKSPGRSFSPGTSSQPSKTAELQRRIDGMILLLRCREHTGGGVLILFQPAAIRRRRGDCVCRSESDSTRCHGNSGGFIWPGH